MTFQGDKITAREKVICPNGMNG